MVITLFAGESTAEPMTDGAPLLAPQHLEQFQLEGERASWGELEIIDIQGQPFDRAIRLITHNDPGSEWGLQATLKTDFDIHRGDVLLARFWMRCVESMSGEGHTGFVVEPIDTPDAKAVELRVGAGKKWIQLFAPFKAMRNFPAGSAQIAFRGGFDRQTIEIGGIELINQGPDADLAQLPRTHITYSGRDANAPWRKTALERIEQIRKGDLTVHVVDPAGKPVPGATVNMKLKRHAFGFGSCVTADQITGARPEDIKAREIIETYFNRVVFENDMKWPAMWDGAPATLDRAVDWLLERQIEIRGHNLLWPSWQWSPTELRAYERDPKALRRLCEKRVATAVSHFKGKLIHWDVVNEPFNNVDLLNILGTGVIADWLKLARAADPDCKLFVNDFGIFDGGSDSPHRRHYFETIQTLKQKGAPIDGIGIQSHFGATLPTPTNLLAVLDQFSAFGLPIESTEFTINNADRELQADYMRDYMIAVFSHPNVAGIMHWGFWEGRHWRPPAALWTRDWSPLPHAKVWIDLVTRQWSTQEKKTTDATGGTKVRGFLGEYTIDVIQAGQTQRTTAKLTRDGTAVRVVMESD
jgi:GH35 family endo-1,4-beta-xylanase